MIGNCVKHSGVHTLGIPPCPYCTIQEVELERDELQSQLTAERLHIKKLQGINDDLEAEREGVVLVPVSRLTRLLEIAESEASAGMIAEQTLVDDTRAMIAAQQQGSSDG